MNKNSETIVISKLYKASFLILSIIMFVMILAGSHERINFENRQTLFLALTSIFLFIVFVTLSIKSNSIKSQMTIGWKYFFVSLMIIIIGLAAFCLVWLILFDFDKSSLIPYLGVITFFYILIRSAYILKMIVS